MLSRRVPIAAGLAGLGVVLVAAALAVPAIEVRSALRPGVALEVSLAHAPALWKGILITGTGLPTLFALALATLGIANIGTHASRLAFIGAAGGLQLDIALLRLAAWDVLGTGAGVAGTRFGLVMLGASVGLMLLAAAAVKTSDAPRYGPSRSRSFGDMLGVGRRRSPSYRPAGGRGLWARAKSVVSRSPRSEWL